MLDWCRIFGSIRSSRILEITFPATKTTDEKAYIDTQKAFCGQRCGGLLCYYIIEGDALLLPGGSQPTSYQPFMFETVVIAPRAGPEQQVLYMNYW